MNDIIYTGFNSGRMDWLNEQAAGSEKRKRAGVSADENHSANSQSAGFGGMAQAMSRDQEGRKADNGMGKNGVRESAVAEYKRKHPEDAAHVDVQVKRGQAVREKYGVSQAATEEMTMDEYKRYINDLLGRIPFDSTRIYDKEMVSISEKGWEQMKNDPDYEAWILGYTAENRSVRNPFFGMSGASGNFCVERFGASIEEHRGESISSGNSGTRSKASKPEKSWWEMRHERMEELLEEFVKTAQVKKAAAHEAHLRSERLAVSASEAYERLTNMVWK